MLPRRIADATRVLAETQDEYIALAIRDGELDGVPYMVSVWEPTPQELEMLKEGGAVHLFIMGRARPPVMLSVRPAP